MEDIVVAAASAVLLIGFAVLWLTTDFSSVSNSSDNLGRFIYAAMHVAVPTSEFAVYLEIVLAIVGGVTIASRNFKTYLFGMLVIYLMINFIAAWFAAPI